jgi:hypothetical protein
MRDIGVSASQNKAKITQRPNQISLVFDLRESYRYNTAFGNVFLISDAV